MIEYINLFSALILYIGAIIGVISGIIWGICFWPYIYFYGKYYGFERNKMWEPKEDYKKYVQGNEFIEWWLKYLLIILIYSQKVVYVTFTVIAISLLLFLVTR